MINYFPRRCRMRKNLRQHSGGGKQTPRIVAVSLTTFSHSGDKTMTYFTKSGRPSASRLRYVLLLSLSLCVLSQQSAWSQDGGAPPCEAARPCGFFFSCQQFE